MTIDATIRRVYYVKDKQHLTTLATEEDLRKGLASRKVADLEITFLASTSVPQSWIKTCRICGASFIARNRCQQGCRRVDHRGRYVCVLELERLQEG